MKLLPGQVLNITSGEYSDYRVRDSFRVIEEFDPALEAQLYRLSKSSDLDKELDGQHPYADDQDRYLAWLLRRNKVEPFEVVELHIGGYGHLEIAD